MKKALALVLIVMLLLCGCGQKEAAQKDEQTLSTQSQFHSKMKSLIDIHGNDILNALDIIKKTYEENGADYSTIESSYLPEDTKKFLKAIYIKAYKVLDDENTVACQMEQDGEIYGFYYSYNGSPKLINITSSTDFDPDYYAFTKKINDIYYWNLPDSGKDWYYTESLGDNWWFWEMYPKN
jgi:hypothetical protein